MWCYWKWLLFYHHPLYNLIDGSDVIPSQQRGPRHFGEEIVQERGKLYKHYLKLSENACLRMSNIVKMKQSM